MILLNKDPAGFVFTAGGKFYRQVNKDYANHFVNFIQSGLCETLKENGFLLPFTEVKENYFKSAEWYTTLLPEQLKYISYPYEWCFSQLKDAALLTLQIAKLSIERGMILKDATPYNIQFRNGEPVLIDTLSFEDYDETKPWIAYRQFCESFLFPLWLSHYHKTNFQRLLAVYPDGIPLETAAPLFPWRSHFNLYASIHVHFHRRISKGIRTNSPVKIFSKRKLVNILNNLEDIIHGLDNQHKTEWRDYYTEGISHASYLEKKELIVRELLKRVEGHTGLDIGANDGFFSLIASERNFSVVSIDSDEGCIDKLYQRVKQERISNILPLCIDIINPSPATGFAYKERLSFQDRVKADLVLMLALIHHLVIGKNIPLVKLAEFLASIAPQLILEFVDKEDEKIQQLLTRKKDIFPDYTQENFERVFQLYFIIEERIPVSGTFRTIYLMKKRDNK